jgi:peroxiredoxin
MDEMYKKYRDQGLMVASITTDSAHEARSMSAHNKIEHPYLVDRMDKIKMGEISTLYHRWKGEYVIDSTGHIVETFENGITFSKYAAVLAKLGFGAGAGTRP